MNSGAAQEVASAGFDDQLDMGVREGEKAGKLPDVEVVDGQLHTLQK